MLGVKARTFMDRGEYVPDDVVVEMVMDRMQEPDAREGVHPRRVPANGAAGRGVGVGARRGRTTALGRPQVLDRRRHGGAAAHRAAGPVRTASARTTSSSNRLCRKASATSAATALQRRADDDELTVRRRIEVYREQTAPLERFYRERGLLREVDAQAREAEVTERTMAILADIED